MESKIFKSLSPAQQKVVNCLMAHNAYVIRSSYYNHNKVNSRIPLTYKDMEYHCLMRFTRPTFDVLLRKEIIKHGDGENKDIYILNPDL